MVRRTFFLLTSPPSLHHKIFLKCSVASQGTFIHLIHQPLNSEPNLKRAVWVPPAVRDPGSAGKMTVCVV